MMNPKQFEALTEHMKREKPKPTTSVLDLMEKARTLVYGTHINDKGGKDTFHVYLSGGLIHRLIYRGSFVGQGYGPTLVEYDARIEWPTEDLIPSKRSFPERCDFAFMSRVVQHGISPNFTTYNEYVEDRGQFAGYIREQISR